MAPVKAGTPKKPAAHTLSLALRNDPQSQTTAERIVITFRPGLKVSTKGLTLCRASEPVIVDTKAAACKSSRAGSGRWTVRLVPSNVLVTYHVIPLVTRSGLYFYLSSQSGGLVERGTINGRVLTITIDEDLQKQSLAYAAFGDLTVRLSKRTGKRSLISSTACVGKAHRVDAKVFYVNNPLPPAARSATKSAKAKCS